MHIDWATLAAIAVVAAAATLTVVLLVSFAIVASSPRSNVGVDGRPAARRAVALLCVFAAGLIVSYGLYLIIA